MTKEIKIDVELGGEVTQGQPFKWKNNGPNKVKASGLLVVCGVDSYDVPAAGEKDATVLATATLGPHEYTTGPGGTNPKLTVNTSMPRPKK
jgi:hypothetical protein